MELKDDSPTKFPDPEYLTLESFKRGVITLLDKSRLPKNALERADNLFLVEDGQPSPRPGVDWFGTQVTASVTTPAATAAAAAGTNWTNPTNVYASDDSRATYANANQNDLVIDTFDLAVPTGATILGVTVSVEGNGADATAANRSIEVGLTTDGSTLDGDRAAAQNLNQTTDTTLTFGGTSSLFNTTLTPEQVNSDDFGVLLRAGNTNTATRSIDHVSVTVTFTPAEAIDGFDYFDFDGVIHIVAVAGGVVFRSTNDGVTWTACSGAYLTTGENVNMNQNGGFLYLTNGTDPILRYDGTTTLQTYTELAAPTGVTATKTGLASTTYTYYYKVAAVNAIGFSEASANDDVTVSLIRDNWDATSNYVTVTWSSVTSALRYDVYISENDVDYFYIGSTLSTELSFKDDGSYIPVPSTKAPTDNTTTGPKVKELVNVGSRQYGVRDSDNRYRIWFTGADVYAGAFSTAYDGGYLDWQEGGKFIPTHVEDYRDGKNEPRATVWCDSSDGQGCILQMQLEVLTIGDISIIVPSAYRLPGSRGTPAAGSVVNVLNDFMFYNSQAFYNLGSRAQFLNLLSTDEASANIRPTVKQVRTAGEANIASVYFDAKVYFSVPYSGSTNDHVAIFDTERKAWLPKAFTIGFKKFLRYTGTDNVQRLLALKAGDNTLSEISEDIQGDYGEPFITTLLTGLYPTTKNRFEFQWTEEAEIELSQPNGDISVDLLGIDRKIGFGTVKSKTMSFTSSNSGVGWDTFAWDTTNWDDTSTVPDVVSESSAKRYFNVQKEMNAVQWQIVTTQLSSDYVLRTLQTWGTNTLGGKPRQWRV